MRNPPLNYTVDVPGSMPTIKVDAPKHLAQPPTPAVTKTRSASTLESSPPSVVESSAVRILKVRLVGKEEYEKDFIEIDVPAQSLSFRKLIDVICGEFSIDPSIIVKIRKLPNTKLRRDVEVLRLSDYQELEVETTVESNAESSGSEVIIK